MHSDSHVCDTRDAVAVVGLGCRLPGGIDDLAGLERLLATGEAAFTPVPAERWDAAEHGPRAPVGAFLDDVDRFDAEAFGISPREAREIDPQQRLLLEVAWEALSDAGGTRADWEGSRTAVFTGLLAQDYALLHARTRGLGDISPYYASGKEFSFAAGRIAHALDLHGPALSLSTACSSSLVAVHLACGALRRGEVDAALAGGVNLLLAPELSTFMDRVGALSPTGRCRPFDASADGVVRGEGAGLVVLKRLEDAVRDRDHVWAVLRGSAVGHDGHSAGLTVPNADAQIRLTRAALADAGLESADIDVVEAHATGTPLGDPIEMAALRAVYDTGERVAPLLVGSHKGVLGHLDAAAGIVGLLRAIATVRSGSVAPQAGLETPTPRIDWGEGGVHVPQAPAALTECRRRWRAAVNAFGLSGTNAQVIVEAPPAPVPADTRATSTPPLASARPATAAPPASPASPAAAPSADADEAPARPLIVPLGARSEAGLARRAERLSSKIEDGADARALADAAAARREHGRDLRAAAVGVDAPSLARALQVLASGDAGEGAVRGSGDRVDGPVLVFSGQGAQWGGMAADLLDASPAFRRTIEDLDALAAPLTGWSLVDELRARPGRLDRTEVAQPCVFAVQVGLFRLLRSWGVEPVAVVGHSMGEIAAAHCAGALSAEDAVRLIVRRGALLAPTQGTGAMLAVERPAAELEALLPTLGTGAVLAADNGPASCVASGTAEELRVVAAALEKRGVRAVELPGGYPFHSPLVADAAEALRDEMAEMQPVSPSLRLLSSVTAGDAPELDAAYWARNVREPVRLWPALDALFAELDPVVIELGPHPVLRRGLLAGLRAHDRSGGVLPTLRRDTPALPELAEVLAGLFAAGVDLDWEAWTGGRPANVPLPPPDWRDERAWLPGLDVGQQSIEREPAIPLGDLRVTDADGRPLGRVVFDTETGEAAPAPVAPGDDEARVPAAAPAPEAPPEADVVAPADEPTAARAAAPATPDTTALETLVRDTARAVLELPAARRLAARTSLFELGLDSVTAVELTSRLGEAVGAELPATLVFEVPTVAGLVEKLAELAPAPAPQPVATPEPAVAQPATPEPGVAEPELEPAAAAEPAREPRREPETTPAAPAPAAEAPRGAEPIAIVGLGARVPGADDADALWELVREARCAVGDVPPDRARRDGWDAVEAPARAGLLDDVAGFDTAFFKVAPREAEAIDPQQRLFLEVAWEAIADAGLRADDLTGAQAGVYVGLNTADYGQRVGRDPGDVPAHFGTGTSFAAAGGRLSHLLGLGGPSIAVDTACSSSLTAVHLACQALRAGECRIAIAGGANVLASPTVSVAMTRAGALAPDGRCKTFAEGADGYGRGEGAGAIVLRPLSDALAAGDRVHAVILGSAVNQDGASGGLTVPSGPAQSAVVRAALERAGVAPSEIDYVEAHGTGTSLGDPIELRALAEVFGNDGGHRVRVGSLKANVGHLEAAAGIAGLLKVVAALKAETLPPHLMHGEPSTRVAWDALPLALEREPAVWSGNGTRRAGVSAFGFTGSNAHVVLGGAPAKKEPVVGELPSPFVLPLSAVGEPALRAMAAELAAFLAAGRAPLADVAYTLARRRIDLPDRAAVVARDAAEAVDALRALAEGRDDDPRVVVGDGLREGDSVALHFSDDEPDAAWLRVAREHPAYEAAAGAVADAGGKLRSGGPGVALLARHLGLAARWRAAGVRVADASGTGVGALAAANLRGELDLPGAVKRAAGKRAAAPLALRGDVAAIVEAGLTGELCEGASADRSAMPALVACVRDGEAPDAAVARTVATLWAAGCAVALDAVAPATGNVVTLPAYPWRRRTCWWGAGADPTPAPARTEAAPLGEMAGRNGATPVDDGAKAGSRGDAAAASRGGAAPEDGFFAIEWVAVEAPEGGGDTPGLVVGDADGLAGELARALGAECVGVPEVWREVLDGAARIVLVADAAQELLGAGRALLAHTGGWATLEVVTAGPQPGAWEAGRVLAVELAERFGGLVEVPREGGAEAAATALRTPERDDQLRFDGERWSAARLRAAPAAGETRAEIDPARWYVVSGADTPEAEPVLRWLEDRGATKLVLGTGPATEASAGGDAGAELPPLDAEQVEHWVPNAALPGLTERLGERGELGGVLHVAPAVPSTPLAKTERLDGDAAASARLLARLDEATRGARAPGLFLALGQGGPAWGAVGALAGADAAGRSAATIRARAATGAPAQWLGLLARAGEVDERQRALLSGSGIAELDDAAVVEALGRATATDATELTHGAVDLETYVALTQSLAPRAFLADLASDGGSEEKTALRTELEGLDREARTERLVDHVVGAAAEALGLPEEDVGPRRGLFDLGLDSIMALTLKTALERDLAPLELPSTLTVELPTCLAIAKHLAGLLEGAPAPAPAATHPHDDHPKTTTRSPEPAPDDDAHDEAEPDPLAALDAAIGSAEELLNTGGAAR